MEIKCANFNIEYPEIENVVKDASFVALDVEFLGLDVEEPNNKYSLFDTPEERYAKLLRSIKRFPPVQLGLAFFKKSEEADRYDVSTYSIYLYRRGQQRQDFDFSVSSLFFLRNHGFDFNSFVNEGVSHLNLDDLEDVINRLVNYYDGLESFGPNMREAVNRVQQTLYQRLSRYRRRSTGSEGAASRYFEPFYVNIDRENLNELQKNVLLYKLYCGVPGVRMKINENHIECDSSRLTKRELIQIKQRLLERIRRELMGVSEIVMAIIEKKLPVIGHNGLYDLMYLYQHFIANLPETYAKFKDAIHAVIPHYIDTKHLAEECTHKLSLYGIISYRLETIGNFFNNNPASSNCVPKISFEMAYKANSGRRSYHNAGFDATTTGKIFIRLAHLIAKPMHNFECGPLYPFEYLMELMGPFSNRVPVALLGIPYISIVGVDPPLRKPSEVRVKLCEEGTVKTLQQELKEQFGAWRCDIKEEEDFIRIASNTETTSRRVYNYLLSRSCYNILEVPQPQLPSSYSTPYRSPSPRHPYGSNDSIASSKVSSSKEAEKASVYDWVYKIGSFLLNSHISVSGTKSLF